MNSLPFLEENKLPVLRKLSGVSKYGFSEDDDLIEQSLNELIQAVESKDHKMMMQALKALIECVMAREESNAPDTLKEA